MYYMTETQPNYGYNSRRAVKLNSETLQKARLEAVEKQFFKGTVIYIGEKIDFAGFLANAICEYRNGKWKKVQGI